jgi:hypothetical protein
MHSQSMFADPVGMAALAVSVVVVAGAVWVAGRLWIVHRAVRVSLLLCALAIGGLFGVMVLREGSDYLASIILQQAVFLALLSAIVSGVWAIQRRTRRTAWVGLVCTATMFAGLWVTIIAGYYLGLAAYVSDRPVPLD